MQRPTFLGCELTVTRNLGRVSIKDQLRSTPIFRVAQDARWLLFHRGIWREEQARRSLYRPFVSRGALVFDLGANVGRVTDALVALGARVVAVEPNPKLAALLRTRHPYKVTVEQTAVGAETGSAEMQLGIDPAHSTLSPEWQKLAPTHDRWSGTITVPVTTLDDLIARHGSPAFVKIDVEGLEFDVLTGLTRDVPALSFEYQGAYPENAERCLAQLGDGWEYALTQDNGVEHVVGWGTADAALAYIRTAGPDAWGDVFARRAR